MEVLGSGANTGSKGFHYRDEGEFWNFEEINSTYQHQQNDIVSKFSASGEQE